MNNSLWLLWSSSKEGLLRFRWVITGPFVSVLGAVRAKVQLGYPLRVPSAASGKPAALSVPLSGVAVKEAVL